MKKIQLIAGIVMTIVIALSAGVAPYEKKFDVDFSKARHTDWDYTSGGATVEADLAYWLNRLAQSLDADDPDQLDYEAAFRLNTGKPSFDFLDKTYHLWDGEKLTDYEAEQWQFERKEVLKRMQQIESIGLPESPDYSGDDKETKARKLGQYMVTKANAQLARALKSDNPGPLPTRIPRAGCRWCRASSA